MEIGKVYKNGLSRVKILKKNGDGSYRVNRWTPNEDSKELNLTKRELSNFTKITEMEKLMESRIFKIRKLIESGSSVDDILEKTKEEYQKFFNSILDKYGVSSPAELSVEQKKKFFEEVDKGWKADEESDGKLDEFRK